MAEHASQNGFNPDTEVPRADQAASERDDYSIIEGLVDTMTLDDDHRLTPEERTSILKNLYAGPPKCLCCTNWVDDIPENLVEDRGDEASDDDKPPLLVRHNVMKQREEAGGRYATVHSIQVCHAATRAVLCRVFAGMDRITQGMRYLTFHAPFHPFFYRWDEFERAIADERCERVKKILLTLRMTVKAELAQAFVSHKEIVENSVVSFKFLWTLYRPGELIYSSEDGTDRFFFLQQVFQDFTFLTLEGVFVDYSGTSFGMRTRKLSIKTFEGHVGITTLKAFPAKYLDDFDEMKEKLIARGKKFASLQGIQFKSYRADSESDDESDDDDSARATLDPRIIIDVEGGPKTPNIGGLWKESNLVLVTRQMNQVPWNVVPPGGHKPLPEGPPGMMPPVPGVAPPYCRPPPPRHRGHPMPPPPPPGSHRPTRPAGRKVKNIKGRRVKKRASLESLSSEDSDYEFPASPGYRWEPEDDLTDFHHMICNSKTRGFSLKDKGWKKFDIDCIRDVVWDSKPFNSLVLPDGYKDLILGFVESQLIDHDKFDDVINGKGGGLVILLSGEPGVGKTLTAESVAERIKAPLYKLDLGEGSDLFKTDSDSDSDTPSLEEAFESAARWGAVLLIDECDMYLEKRSTESPQRNKIVSRFLQELEYYPSLLFLTTNRERDLDPAIYSRIHLTINYPSLDELSRRRIWETFLAREVGSNVDEEGLAALAKIDLNGRRIRNIVKTARIMACRSGRGVTFDDIKKVMRVTEGLLIE